MVSVVLVFPFIKKQNTIQLKAVEQINEAMADIEKSVARLRFNTGYQPGKFYQSGH